MPVRRKTYWRVSLGKHNQYFADEETARQRKGTYRLFDNAGKLLMSKAYKGTRWDTDYIYKYNSDGTVQAEYFIDSGELTRVYTYEYDQDRRVSKAVRKDGANVSTETFTYREVDGQLEVIITQNGLKDRDGLRQAIEQGGTSWDVYLRDLKRQLRHQKFQMYIIRPRVVENEDALKDAYNVAHDEYGLTLPFRPDAKSSTPILSQPQIVKIDSPLTNSPTQPPLKEVGRNKRILESWDDPVPSPDIAARMGGNRIVIWLGGIAVVAMLVIGALLMIPGLSPFSPAADATLTSDAVIADGATPIPPTPTPTPIPTVAAEEALLRLNYNVDLIVIVNDGPSALHMNQLNLRGSSEADSLTPALGDIQPGECLIVRNGAQSANVPADWRCEEVRSVTIVAGEPRFWFADSDSDETFGVFSDSRLAGNCETIGRLVSRVDDLDCTLEWPAYDTERQIIN